MNLKTRFNYPFRYAPHPLVKEAAELLISRIESSPQLSEAFADGKMLGVMLVRRVPDGPLERLYAFSGSVTFDGSLTNHLDGFVPPICDLLDPDGFFKRGDEEVSQLNLLIYKGEKAGKDMGAEKARRRELSEMLQRRIFDNYVLLNARGERRSIGDIAREKGMLPPGGTGDCALPKLLQYAYLNGLQPCLFGEFWYGASRTGEVRSHGSFYPSCSSKCGFILPFMLEGLDVEEVEDDSEAAEPEIVFEDESLIVVSKPSGMLTVPGKERSRNSLIASLQRWDRQRSGSNPRSAPTVFAVHRLDMDTSGLVVFAKTPEIQAGLRRQFEHRTVEKAYVARLEAPHGQTAKTLITGDEGTIDLPLASDFLDRPRQKLDFEEGKPALTEYKVMKKFDSGELIVLLRPKTGRTHQLRVHSAHPIGLGRPIVGDRLYGGAAARQLCLCAVSLSFDHPVTGKRLDFRLPLPSWAQD